MKQTKYRDTLQNRRIRPSSGSWEQLEASLDAHEKKDRKNRWWFLKAAAVVLLLISVSYYTLVPDKNLDTTPVVTTPVIKNNHSEPAEINQVSSTEINSSDINTAITEQHSNDIPLTASREDSLIDSKADESVIQVSINDSIIEIMEVVDIPESEELLIDTEVEELLKKSKIKLMVNGQISSEKVVSSEALLNSVEEDLYMDLKQKLIEKITNTLKNPKEVVTSRDH